MASKAALKSVSDIMKHSNTDRQALAEIVDYRFGIPEIVTTLKACQGVLDWSIDNGADVPSMNALKKEIKKCLQRLK